MAGSELSLKDIAEIKRLWIKKISNRQISKITGAHRNTVNKYVDGFKQELISGLSTEPTPAVPAAKSR